MDELEVGLFYNTVKNNAPFLNIDMASMYLE